MMILRRRKTRGGLVGPALAAMAVLILLSTSSQAQGPQLDIGSPPGAAGGASSLGSPLGAADFPDFGSTSSAPLSGGAGRTRSHGPVDSQAIQPGPDFRTSTRSQFAVTPLQPMEVPAYGNLDLSPGDLDYGPPGGLTIDAAIDRLVKNNLDLTALRLEIPMAEADILTANLRANPVFYADQQFVPYGHFSFLRPGGPQQTDINLNYPLDVSRKRQARTQSAMRAKKVSEAQLQDAIRNQIDNLYTVYVDVIAAGLTQRFSQKYVEGINRLYVLNKQLLTENQIKPADVQAIRANLEKAELQVRESKQTKLKANQALALILNMPLQDLEGLDVRDQVGALRPLPLPKEALVTKALSTRPDLAAIRLGVLRAESDVKLARANAYPDVYLLYQPYTFQNNTYVGVQSTYSWSAGVTATVPLYNRNQGNIRRASINVTQTGIQAKSQERAVIADMLNAARELEQSLASVVEIQKEILPASREVRDTAFRRWQGGETSALDFLEAQQSYNDVVRQYRDALIRHRRAVLDLNTAVGERVLP
ncbi:MAG: hypothetical protein NVSMB9_25210 [Isosphaeraceae bacterium]